VKKIAKNVSPPILSITSLVYLTVEKSSTNVWSTSGILKAAQRKQTFDGQKFGQSGHPVWLVAMSRDSSLISSSDKNRLSQ
jgi:hypothetical protein